MPPGTSAYLQHFDIRLGGTVTMTYVPWGEWFQPTAFRKNVRDVLKFGAPIFWNVKVA
jgi:hypothetical protein